MDYKHYSYKGYYITETDDEFKMTTMENHNRQIEDARGYWHFNKIGVGAFETIHDVVEYINKYFSSKSTDEVYGELICLD